MLGYHECHDRLRCHCFHLENLHWQAAVAVPPVAAAWLTVTSSSVVSSIHTHTRATKQRIQLVCNLIAINTSPCIQSDIEILSGPSRPDLVLMLIQSLVCPPHCFPLDVSFQYQKK